ncbi:MAG: hypothetical protein ABI162_11380 [Luteolibacter sp.]
MKIINSTLIALGCGITFLGAEPLAENMATKDASVIPTARTFIPHSLEVLAFTPPAPPVEKKVPAMRVDSAITVHTKSSHSLTLIRGEASTLPDIPVPPKPELQEPHVFTPQETASAAYERRHSLQLGASVYDHRTSLVHWQHPDTGESYEAICGFDLSLLEGLGQFIHDGEIYQIALDHSCDAIPDNDPIEGDTTPDLAKIPAGSITILKGNPKDPTGTAIITLLKELIATEKSRLITYQAARQRYQQASAEWENAHPSVPRDETYWLKPHRGSRYLANPTPEAAIK